MRGRLKDMNLKSCLARRKLQINKVHKRKRLAFAKKYVNKSLSFWRKIIWNDESKFELLNKKKRTQVWRKPNEALKKQHLLSYCQIWRGIYNGMRVFFLAWRWKFSTHTWNNDSR